MSLTKSEISAKLTELGIEHDPSAKVADLKALLPQNEPVQPSAEAGPVVVYDPRGKPHRTFSHEVTVQNSR